MRSSWAEQALAVAAKEAILEFRGGSGLYAAGLFSLVTVVALAVATFGQSPSPAVMAGLLTVAILFSSAVAVPRTVLSEDEARTTDLMRLFGDPGAVFFGKAIYGCLLSVCNGLLTSLAFLLFVSAKFVHWPLLLGGVFGTAVCFAVAVLFCASLSIGSQGRWLLSATIAMPLVLPCAFLSSGVFKGALESGPTPSALQSGIGLAGWALALAASTPLIVGQVWKLETDPLSDGDVTE